MLLTPTRVKTYCGLIVLAYLILLGLELRRPEVVLHRDFVAFYNAGEIFNHFPASKLYDWELQSEIYQAKTGDVGRVLPYVYSPFFILPFAALAKTSIGPASILWVLISIGLLTGGYLLLWDASDLPAEWKIPGLLASLAFPPFLVFTLGAGQTAAVGMFVLSLTFCLYRKGRLLLAGGALALMLYKPSLVFLLFPALLITRQWRALFGFVTGALLLTLISYLLIGSEGLANYAKILRIFYLNRNAPTTQFAVWDYVDLGSALRGITGTPPSFIIRVMLALIPLPLLYIGRRSIWAVTIVCTLLFGPYSPVYDALLLIPVVLLVHPQTIGTRVVLTLFVLSAISVPIAYVTRVELMPIGLMWLLFSLLAPKALPLSADYSNAV